MTGRVNWLRIVGCALVGVALAATTLAAENHTSLRRDQSTLAAYRAELARLRQDGRSTIKLPGPGFFLFGMGPRPKFIYRAGELVEWPSGHVLRKWNVRQETIVPPSYAVSLKTAGGPVRIYENETGLFIDENGKRTTLATGKVRLPGFAGEPYPNILRVLHHEILVNIVDGKPVPNFLVYRRPWYRDGAMMAMVLRRTGNVGLIRDWVMSLRDAFDHNNAGNSEPDNLGEVLYLISCVSDRNHSLVATTLDAVKQFQRGEYIVGVTDGAEHPVYQTKWLKFGLHSLGLPHEQFVVPKIADSYASLFWWDQRDGQIGAEFTARDAANYPYLAWARDHLSGGLSGPVPSAEYPLTWETNASEAKYAGMSLVSPDFALAKTATPHTWHAAEMFLALASGESNF
jgi:hypothetical protein